MEPFYYYGVMHNRSGHYLYARDNGDWIPRYSGHLDLPCAYENLDGSFAPAKKEQGAANLWHLITGMGWTILSFHDYSGDSRPGSSSTFLCKGCYSFSEMVTLACKRFPSIWKRLDEAGVEVRIVE